jgi:glutamine synthetase
LEDIRQYIEQNNIRKIKLGVFDIDGVLRGKYVSVDKFYSSIEKGFGFCEVIFGWDSGDELYADTSNTVIGPQTGYPDTLAKIDIDTARIVPWEPDTAIFITDMYTREGEPLEVSPRQVLQKVIREAKSLGFQPFMSSEYEYFFFRETPDSIREKNYHNLTPLTPGMFGYSIVRASGVSDLIHDIIDQMNAYDIPIEGIHTETGPGVYETAIAYDSALRAADKSALFKTAMKEIASHHNLIVTFMAKWRGDLPGCSGHVHQSLWDDEGKTNLFYNEQDAHHMSDLMGYYLAGQLHLMRGLTVMMAPTINSYKRLVPGAWAPTTASWGIENRTAALRAIPAGEKSTRLECRLPGADVNPYLAMAAMLAAGLYGIKHKMEPPEPWNQNAYTAPDHLFPDLPKNLEEATTLFKESDVVREILGSVFVDHYVATREWEINRFQQAVTDWELARYFEVI